jgi:hypothetical protein
VLQLLRGGELRTQSWLDSSDPLLIITTGLYRDKIYRRAYQHPHKPHIQYANRIQAGTVGYQIIENIYTNFNQVLYAIHGIYKNYGRKDAFLRNIPYLGIMGVGFGSALFHATNKYYTQWGPSLPHCKSMHN